MGGCRSRFRRRKQHMMRRKGRHSLTYQKNWFHVFPQANRRMPTNRRRRTTTLLPRHPLPRIQVATPSEPPIQGEQKLEKARLPFRLQLLRTFPFTKKQKRRQAESTPHRHLLAQLRASRPRSLHLLSRIRHHRRLHPRLPRPPRPPRRAPRATAALHLMNRSRTMTNYQQKPWLRLGSPVKKNSNHQARRYQANRPKHELFSIEVTAEDE
mmetsp:Transcript_17515/g.25944  ORF Transcript_17515/g.25944 Transcript_17515/m.25944 type:complete len:211 (+) Transcript_17515:2083-2715(+)